MPDVMTLAQLREQAGLSRAEVCAAMGVSRQRVAQIEATYLGAMMVSTVNTYVHAIGGRLTLIAQFADGSTVTLL